MKTATQIKRNIMLRVYYVYGLRVVLHPLTLHIALLATATYMVGYFVHVAAVARNMASIPVGEAGGFLARAAMNTEGITLLVVGVVILAILSLPVQLPQYRRSLRVPAA